MWPGFHSGTSPVPAGLVLSVVRPVDAITCSKLLGRAGATKQFPDATIVWTSPSGHKYTTRPGSRLLFPTLCRPTGELPAVSKRRRPVGDRGVMMPARRRIRQQDRTHRIDTERTLNAAHVAERGQPPPFFGPRPESIVLSRNRSVTYRPCNTRPLSSCCANAPVWPPTTSR
jgi:hypothetical protein